jgi:hypothetical protein
VELAVVKAEKVQPTQFLKQEGAEAGAEAVATLETQEDVEEQADAALPEHQQHLTAYQ